MTHLHDYDGDDGLALHLSTPEPQGHGRAQALNAYRALEAAGVRWDGEVVHKRHHSEEATGTNAAEDVGVEGVLPIGSADYESGWNPADFDEALQRAADRDGTTPDEYLSAGGMVGATGAVMEGIEVPIGEVGELTAEPFDGAEVLSPEQEAALQSGSWGDKGEELIGPDRAEVPWIGWAAARMAGLPVFFRIGIRPWTVQGGTLTAVGSIPSTVQVVVERALQRAEQTFESGSQAVYVWEAGEPVPEDADVPAPRPTPRDVQKAMTAYDKQGQAQHSARHAQALPPDDLQGSHPPQWKQEPGQWVRIGEITDALVEGLDPGDTYTEPVHHLYVVQMLATVDDMTRAYNVLKAMGMDPEYVHPQDTP